MKKFVPFVLLALLLVSGAEAENQLVYRSDFSTSEDGWYARSAGGAAVSLTADDSLLIEGRTSDWNSPGRNFDLQPGQEYQLSVQVRQTEAGEARFMISIAHSVGGVESYENLGAAMAKKGEWTTVNGQYTAGAFDQYVLYVETTGAAALSFEIKDFTVTQRVIAENADPLPALKDIYAEKFDFGTAVTYYEAINKQRMDFYATQFNIFTPGNELKPDSVLDIKESKKLAAGDETAVAVHFDAAKPLLDYAKEHGLKVHGHVLVWHQQTPDAFFREGYSTSKPYVTREVMLARLENYIKAVMAYMEENYPGVIVSWDVLNEAVDDGAAKLRSSKWLTIVGEDYPARAFEYARKYAPEGTLLFYNDYNTALEPKQTGIVNLLKDLIAEGNIDGYGFQMHHDLAFPGNEQIEKSLQRIAGLGLQLRVSELDVTVPDHTDDTLQRQAKKYAAIMKMLDEYTDRLLAVQVWGVTDDLSWRAPKYPLLFDKDFQPKPAFWAVADPASVEEK